MSPGEGREGAGAGAGPLTARLLGDFGVPRGPCALMEVAALSPSCSFASPGSQVRFLRDPVVTRLPRFADPSRRCGAKPTVLSGCILGPPA